MGAQTDAFQTIAKLTRISHFGTPPQKGDLKAAINKCYGDTTKGNIVAFLFSGLSAINTAFLPYLSHSFELQKMGHE
jgi:hypothetical protein